MKIYRVIGLMSGTSLDGIDAALLQTDGENHIAREAFLTVPYAEDLRAQIRSCLGKTAAEAGTVERALTVAHAHAVERLLKQQGLRPQDIDLIGFHGQTISHAPARGHTCQIGGGALLAKLTGGEGVTDFRTADAKAGGQGAPVVPVYHQALVGAVEKPVVLLNIGGVANVTYVGKKDELIAFDTGPGNALIDDWMLQKTGKVFDEAGKIAASGTIDQKVLQQLMAHSFFTAPVHK